LKVFLFLVLSLVTPLPALNATEIDELRQCENIVNQSNTEPVKPEEIPQNVTLDTMFQNLFDNAWYIGYCAGLNMRQGFSDAMANKTVATD
jgi:hypothetical protein